MKKKTKNFTWRDYWTDFFNELPMSYKVRLFDAVINYGTYGKLHTLEPYFLNAAFECMRGDIDRERENG